MSVAARDASSQIPFVDILPTGPIGEWASYCSLLQRASGESDLRHALFGQDQSGTDITSTA